MTVTPNLCCGDILRELRLCGTCSGYWSRRSRTTMASHGSSSRMYVPNRISR